MNIYSIKCLIFTKNKNIKIKRKIDRKINSYFCCIDCGLKKFETINEKKVTYVLKV